MRQAIRPHLDLDLFGRNDFEGHRTQRVYSLVGLGGAFEQLVQHPPILDICDIYLADNYLLTASQAICIQPGETPQPLRTDDSFYPFPRPRDAFSLATIWAISEFTAENGGTEVIPGSHLWGDEGVADLLSRIDFRTASDGSPAETIVPPEIEAQLKPIEMPAGSVVVLLGTLLHRGGGNTSKSPRLAMSNQYCQPWARQQENFMMSIGVERVAAMPERVRELLGYSIHPPFMGHVRGRHPKRLLP